MSIYTDCYMPGCNEEVEESATLPVCHSCGWRIAQRYRERIVAEDFNKRTMAREGRIERRKVRRGDRDGSFVYYVWMGDHIKIGFTSTLRSRMESLRVDGHNLLAIEPGGPELERERHRQFAAERIGRRENFRPSDALREHIAALADQHKLPRWATIPPTNIVTTRSLDGKET